MATTAPTDRFTIDPDDDDWLPYASPAEAPTRLRAVPDLDVPEALVLVCARCLVPVSGILTGDRAERGITPHEHACTPRDAA